ncbi:hypothetical protein TNIN_137891 [Trichonephila inaurata madagascariensis]|uniref:Uncharacterized protein n=1 Tax=Trichonephila inaurata madagascariensis TaxID=2747483 RepID=A0A8X6Y1U1_9ARAC|nr:hypothetical protein TNIN_137891 [Trichonephila inaurata madagascariensis]
MLTPDFTCCTVRKLIAPTDLKRKVSIKNPSFWTVHTKIRILNTPTGLMMDLQHIPEAAATVYLRNRPRSENVPESIWREHFEPEELHREPEQSPVSRNCKYLRCLRSKRNLLAIKLLIHREANNNEVRLTTSNKTICYRRSM